MGVPKTRSLLLLLMLWLMEAAINGINGTVCSTNCQKELVGVLGTSVNLSCVYPEKKTFPLDTLMIYWQNDEKAVVVHAFIRGQDDSNDQNQSYKKRTHLFKERLKEGDFSLQILNLTLNDTMDYMCVVMQTNTTTKCIHKSCVSLKVADYVWMVDPTGSYVINEKQTSRAKQATAWVLSTTVILLVVVVSVWLRKRNRCGPYRGVAQVDLALQQQMSEDQSTSLNKPAAPEANDGRPVEANTLH